MTITDVDKRMEGQRGRKRKGEVKLLIQPASHHAEKLAHRLIRLAGVHFQQKWEEKGKGRPAGLSRIGSIDQLKR